MKILAVQIIEKGKPRVTPVPQPRPSNTGASLVSFGSQAVIHTP
jgi:hypothetical protein